MDNIEIIKSALKSLKGNRVRSFLTMLGIIIGIASVITMSSIGKGGQENITGNLKQGGYGKFTVSVDKDDEDFRWKNLITDDLMKKLWNKDKFVAVSPEITQRVFIKVDNKREFTQMEVSTEEYNRIQPIEMKSGRNFIPIDYESGERNIIVDNITAKQMFGSEDEALGKTLDIVKGKNGKVKTFYIIGVMKNPVESMAKMMGGKRFPRFVRIPLKTYIREYDPKLEGYSSIIIESKNPDNLAEDMRYVKESISRLTKSDELYEVNIKNNGAESFDQILTTLNMFVSFVASISLFVGGIGVMNIMLVSVIERTKEIGIRKAIGATDTDILLQFLIESIMLTGVGGIIGVILGVVIALGIGLIIGITPIFSLLSIVLSLGVSMGIGIIFGVTPARKASKLNPIEALRSE